MTELPSIYRCEHRYFTEEGGVCDKCYIPRHAKRKKHNMLDLGAIPYALTIGIILNIIVWTWWMRR